MPTTASFTGRAGTASVNAQTIPITKWTAKVNKALADATDSGNYTGGYLYASQAPGVLSCDGSIEGNFDTNTTNSNLLSIFTNDTPKALVLKYNSVTTCISGNFDLSDVEMTLEVPGATMVKFTANFKSNGTFTID